MDEERDEPGAKEDAPAGAAPGQPPELDDAWADQASRAEAQPPAPTALQDATPKVADSDYLEEPVKAVDAAPPVVVVPPWVPAGLFAPSAHGAELERLRQQPGYRSLFSPS